MGAAQRPTVRIVENRRVKRLLAPDPFLRQVIIAAIAGFFTAEKQPLPGG